MGTIIFIFIKILVKICHFSFIHNNFFIAIIIFFFFNGIYII